MVKQQLMVKQLVPLATISDERLFPKGTVFRILNSLHALNPARPAHYDYMLVPHPEEEETMMSVNVTLGTIKAGYIISYMKATHTLNFITAKEVKRSLGIEGVFYCQY
ncbi:hypothetical protein A8B98_12520 [Hymenobacter sp. UV11]|nr:hypothetical protein A8B98_12520 [Hymenobacter sp. UV11]